MINVRAKNQAAGAKPVMRHKVVEEISWQVRIQRTWSPPTDLYETETAYVVRVEVAGMRPQDFSITLEPNNVLTIRGVRADIPSRRAYYQMEIRSGEFSTLVALPGFVNEDTCVADYENGFLTILLPKA